MNLDCRPYIEVISEYIGTSFRYKGNAAFFALCLSYVNSSGFEMEVIVIKVTYSDALKHP
jgi:hypothetical protein